MTGGVLRGEKGRFQLFGDTINMASRMESTGVRGKIQVSPETAKLLIEAGKEAWLTPREDLVQVKGRGIVKTYFVQMNPKSVNTKRMSISERLLVGDSSSKAERLISWNVEIFSEILKAVVAKKKSIRRSLVTFPTRPNLPSKMEKSQRMALQEVVEIIELPACETTGTLEATTDTEPISLDPKVLTELHNLISKIAGMYRDNPFHNFGKHFLAESLSFSIPNFWFLTSFF